MKRVKPRPDYVSAENCPTWLKSLLGFINFISWSIMLFNTPSEEDWWDILHLEICPENRLPLPLSESCAFSCICLFVLDLSWLRSDDSGVEWTSTYCILSIFFLWRLIHLFIWKAEWHKGRNREDRDCQSSICWFTPPTVAPVAPVRAGPGRGQEPATPLGSSVWVVGTPAPGPRLLLPQQEAGPLLEQLGHNAALGHRMKSAMLQCWSPS